VSYVLAVLAAVAIVAGAAIIGYVIHLAEEKGRR